MKPANLMLSAAIASLMLFTPAAFTISDAAGIKIKPQIVKVRPKIAVAKPKVRVKVRAAKARVKHKIKINTVRIKPRIKITPVTPKLVAKVKVQPKILPAVQVKPRVKPQLKVVGKLKVKQPNSVHPRANRYRPNRRVRRSEKVLNLPKAVATPQPVQVVTLPTVAIAKSDVQANIKDVVQAVRAADTAKDGIALGKVRTTATPEMGLPTPETARQVPSNSDVLDSMRKQPERGGNGAMNQDSLWSQGSAGGFGPDYFAGLPHTHGQASANSKGSAASDAAKGFWGVTQDKITAGMEGVASEPDSDRPHDERRIDSHSSGTRHIIHEDRDGNKHEQWITVNGGHEGSQYSEERRVDGTVSAYRESRRDGVTRYEGTDTRTGRSTRGTTELRDPDSGYAGTSPFPWLNEKEKADLSTVENGKSPGGLPASPDHSQPTGWSSGSAMYSSSDLLERYDEASHNREERFKKPKNLCFHSEC